MMLENLDNTQETQDSKSTTLLKVPKYSSNFINDNLVKLILRESSEK